VLITQFGQPIRVISSPGLHAKVPFIQTVISFDRRLLDFESVGEEVILADQRRLIVDSFTRFRITDPLRYFQAVGPQENGIRARLNSVVTSSLRRVLGNETLLNVLSNERARIMGRTKTQVSEEMKGFGIAIEDVRLRRADLPEENTQAILGRMKSERERVASQLRAEGAEASLKIRADADRDRTVLLAEARANADKLRGDGERQAIKIYADAFQQDPAFYETYRTLQAYREAFGAGSGANGGSRLVLTPDVDFLKLLREAPKP
jgi:membrane protease subunit HflC